MRTTKEGGGNDRRVLHSPGLNPHVKESVNPVVFFFQPLTSAKSAFTEDLGTLRRILSSYSLLQAQPVINTY